MVEIIAAIDAQKLDGDVLKHACFIVFRMDSSAHESRPRHLRPAGNFEYRNDKYAVYFNNAPCF
jgi:hypothetical protein